MPEECEVRNDGNSSKNRFCYIAEWDVSEDAIGQFTKELIDYSTPTILSSIRWWYKYLERIPLF